ncbi:hypothetical protein [Flavobacterium mesophilum]|uniref:hypothetical protein n=1 Tax=Flavobacterium mesophilum TaxID=3143495 RepID=UPI0031D71491
MTHSLETFINNEAFRLFEKLSIEDLPTKYPVVDFESKSRLIGEKCIGTFKLKENDRPIYSEQDLLGNAINIACNINGKKIGYNVNTYPELIDLAVKFLEVDYFNSFVDFEFVSRKIFDWIIILYEKSKADFDLYTYVHNETEKELKNYTFFFIVQDLIIEEEFKIGASTFTSKKEEYFETISKEIVKKSINKTNEEKGKISQLHNSFIDKVLICSTMRAVKRKAEALIKKEVELSVNAIKSLLIEEALQPDAELFHVDFLANSNRMCEYFSVADSVDDYCHYMQSLKNPTPVTIDKNRMRILAEGGLCTLNSFLLHKKNTELYYRTESQINLLGEINSTKDLYSKIIKLISYFENVLIPVNNSSSKGQTYMKNIISLLPLENQAQSIRSVNKIYETRDKYLHNRTMLPIDYRDLFCVNLLAVVFLLTMADLNDEIDTIEEMQLTFGIQNKVKSKK